jgi:hypothetical protein
MNAFTQKPPVSDWLKKQATNKKVSDKMRDHLTKPTAKQRATLTQMLEKK